jgi:hypothetical protein
MQFVAPPYLLLFWHLTLKIIQGFSCPRLLIHPMIKGLHLLPQTMLEQKC